LLEVSGGKAPKCGVSAAGQWWSVLVSGSLMTNVRCRQSSMLQSVTVAGSPPRALDASQRCRSSQLARYVTDAPHALQP